MRKIKLARALAEVYHAGQFYGTEPYFFHIEEVVQNVERLHEHHPMLESLIVIAYLHDIVEDTNITIADLKRLKFFSVQELTAIEAITKLPRETYEDYLIRLKSSPLAVAVKLADALANLTASIASGSIKRIDKYTNVIKELHV